MNSDNTFVQSIVNHTDLSTVDLVNTMLVYLTSLSKIDDAEQAYGEYCLCKPALARIHREDLGAFALISRKIKELLRIPMHSISEDMERLTASTRTNGQIAPQGGQADLIVALTQNLTLFHDDLGDPYAAIQVNGHQEIWRCRSRSFRRYLVYRFFQQYEKTPSNEALTSALGVIEGKAIFDGQQFPLYNRVAWHDGAIWYDLSDSAWRAVKISAQGWEIVTNPPILFRRYTHQAPQVEPVRGSTLALLDKYVNLSKSACRLLQITLCTYLVPDIPHAGLHPHGEQGAGKSFLLRVVREVVNPSQVPLLSFPSDKAELVQQLAHHYCAFYDNLSTIPPWISDALCRAVTGEGFSKRELYSDDDDIIYKFRRCIGLNGINVAATAPDLLDRLILAEMRRIEEEHRAQEKILWGEFQQHKPKILGAIFDMVAQAIKTKPQIQLTHLPRMADFTVWGEAISRALGHKDNEFITLYHNNIQSQHEEVVRGHAVAAAIVELMAGRTDAWEGTATELFGALGTIAEKLKLDVKDKGWPKAPNTLTRRLKEVLSNLRGVGIAVSFGDDDKHRSKIRLEKGEKESPKPPEPKESSDSKGLDAGGIAGDIKGTDENPPNISDEDLQMEQGLGDFGGSGGVSPPFSETNQEDTYQLGEEALKGAEVF